MASVVDRAISGDELMAGILEYIGDGRLSLPEFLNLYRVSR